MKKMKLRSSLFVGAAVLLFSFPSLKKVELTDIAKPYLGVYECTDAKLGEEDMLSRFADVKLELKDKGTYILYFTEKGGKEKRVQGKYSYDKGKKTVTLYVPNRRSMRRAFPLEKGVLTVTVPYGDKTLRMQFEQK